MSWRRFLRRRWWDDERAAELDAHLAMEIDDNVARGMSRDEARAAAYRKLGNPVRIREDIYEMNTLGRLERLWQDVRYGVRVLRRSPTFALVAIMSLALGVGANTAMFQLLDAVRLRTLPVRDPASLALIQLDSHGGRSGTFHGRFAALTNAQWEGLRDEQRSFDGMFAWGTASFSLSIGGEDRRAQGLWVSGSFFETLGVQPAIGRLISPLDDVRGCASPGAVLSHAFWQREYGGQPSAVGATIHINGHPFEIAGVTPASFFGVEVGRTFDVAMPICTEPVIRGEASILDRRDGWWLAAMGRLRPGVTIEKASAELGALSAPLFAATIPPSYGPDEAEFYRHYTLHAVPAATGVSDLRRSYGTPLWLLLGLAGLLLLVACGNLANLMLARATTRDREMAVRLAIGASRGRLVHQLMTESLLIAVAGAALGAWIARLVGRALVTMIATESDPVAFDLSPDWRVLAFAAGLAVATCLLFGLAPALRVAHARPAALMRGARGLTDTRARLGLRRVLVVVQLALSLVLVVGALLFFGTFHNLATLDPGFRAAGVVVADVDFRRASVPAGRRVAFTYDLLARLRALPGVGAAAAVRIIPINDDFWNEAVVIDGVRQKGTPNVNRVSAGYFSLLDVPILRGRAFTERDVATSPPVAVVTAAFVAKFLPGVEPVGRTFQFQAAPGESSPAYEIVGVAGDTKYGSLREAVGPIVYLPDTQDEQPPAGLTALLRVTGPASSLTADVVASVRAADPAAIVTVRALDAQMLASLARERLMATLSAFFAGLAIVLAAVGLYGVMSYMVTTRRHEIGIRLALGATRGRVLRLVLAEALRLIAVGLVIGAAIAGFVARTAETLLFGLTPNDPRTLAASVIGLAVVAAITVLLPGRRAARVEPSVALRES